MKAFSVTTPARGAVQQIDLQIEVRVTGMKILRARLWLGCMVMRFGAWVIGVGRCEIIEK